jgi:hypothetical protein
MDPFTQYVVVSIILAITGAASARAWLSLLPIATAPLVLWGHGISPSTAAALMPIVAVALVAAELAARRNTRRAA